MQVNRNPNPNSNPNPNPDANPNPNHTLTLAAFLCPFPRAYGGMVLQAVITVVFGVVVPLLATALNDPICFSDAAAPPTTVALFR